MTLLSSQPQKAETGDPRASRLARVAISVSFGFD